MRCRYIPPIDRQGLEYSQHYLLWVDDAFVPFQPRKPLLELQYTPVMPLHTTYAHTPSSPISTLCPSIYRHSFLHSTNQWATKPASGLMDLACMGQARDGLTRKPNLREASSYWNPKRGFSTIANLASSSQPFHHIQYICTHI